jgi:hypothetical protein
LGESVIIGAFRRLLGNRGPIKSPVALPIAGTSAAFRDVFGSQVSPSDVRRGFLVWLFGGAMMESPLYRRIAVCAACLAWFLWSNSDLAAADSAEKIRELRQRRLAILEEIQKVVSMQYGSGNVGYDAVHNASTAVLKAQLELCQTKQERVAVWRKLIDEAKQWNHYVEQGSEAGKRSEVDRLDSAIYLLDCEIGLERTLAEKYY